MQACNLFHINFYFERISKIFWICLPVFKIYGPLCMFILLHHQERKIWVYLLITWYGTNIHYFCMIYSVRTHKLPNYRYKVRLSLYLLRNCYCYLVFVHINNIVYLRCDIFWGTYFSCKNEAIVLQRTFIIVFFLFSSECFCGIAITESTAITSKSQSTKGIGKWWSIKDKRTAGMLSKVFNGYS